MAKHFWRLLYWAKTGRRSFGYLFSKRDYHHALDRYKQKQVIKTEKDEIDNEE
jgi:hypothetical protein